MFQDLAKDACKGYGTVVYSLLFVIPFEHWNYISSTPVYVMGNFSVSTDLSKITWMIGEISSLSSLRIKGLILSGPSALPGFRLLRNFVIPFIEISSSGILGT